MCVGQRPPDQTTDIFLHELELSSPQVKRHRDHIRSDFSLTEVERHPGASLPSVINKHSQSSAKLRALCGSHKQKPITAFKVFRALEETNGKDCTAHSAH